MELADMQDLGSCALWRAGSSPAIRIARREAESEWFRFRAILRIREYPSPVLIGGTVSVFTVSRTINTESMEGFMGIGIIVCGLNGVGKSTLGRALAKKLHFSFIDNEDLYFPKTDTNYLYASPRTCEEVEKLLLNEIKTHENFVFASVKGNYGKAVYPFFQYVILLEAPWDIRIKRVKKRSFEKFGNRMLPGGDLHEQEERFFDLVKSRAENTVEEWIQSLRCPVIRVDGTKPVEENTDFIAEQIARHRISNDIGASCSVVKDRVAQDRGQ